MPNPRPSSEHTLGLSPQTSEHHEHVICLAADSDMTRPGQGTK
jgi:hypothetical protein